MNIKYINTILQINIYLYKSNTNIISHISLIDICIFFFAEHIVFHIE